MRSLRNASPLILAAALLAASCATAGSTGKSSKAGSAADFTLNTSDGRTMSLSQHLGKKVILMNFWATWCMPCASELPHLQELYENHKDEGLMVLSIAMDGPETMANVGPFVRRQGLKYPVLLDPETRAVTLYNPTRAAPFNVIIDREGRVVSAREGFAAGDEKAMEETLVALLHPGTAPVPALASDKPAAGPDAAPATPPCHHGAAPAAADATDSH